MSSQYQISGTDFVALYFTMKYLERLKSAFMNFLEQGFFGIQLSSQLSFSGSDDNGRVATVPPREIITAFDLETYTFSLPFLLAS